jgi:DNA polymerase-1
LPFQRITQSQLQYAANDAAIVLPLYRVLKNKLKEANLLSTAKDEFNCVRAVARMELNGIKLDLEQWLDLSDRLREQQQQLQQSIDLQLNSSNQFQQLSLAKELNPSINLRSPTQIIRALDNIGISVKSTSASELVFLAPKYPIIEQLLEYRSIATRVSTFSDGLPNYIHPVTGRIHGNWFQLGARSGRFSCSQPNLTNIPRDVETRSCFVASPGNVLIKADYSQIELRLIAKVSGDRRMCRAYQQGRDLHRLTAAHIFNTEIDVVTEEQRRLGKIVNFGLIYGMGAKKFCITTARDYGIYLKTEEAKLFRDRFFQLYQGITDYHIKVRKQWQKEVRVSRTLDGRRRLWSKQNPPTLNEMLNYPIQGTNATILKRAIASVDRLSQREQLDINLIAVVHDEILLECPKYQAKRAANLLKRCMLDAARPELDPIPVIVELKIANSWK